LCRNITMSMIYHSVVSVCKSSLLVELDHICCDFQNSFAEGFRR